MGTHVPYGITECYLPPGRGDIPAFTPAKAGTRLSIPGGMQGCVDLGTAVKVQSPCPRLHIAVAIGINTTIGCEIRTQVLSYLSLSQRANHSATEICAASVVLCSARE